MQKLTRFKILHIASLALSACLAVFLVFNFLMQLNSSYKLYKAIASTAASVRLGWEDAITKLPFPDIDVSNPLTVDAAFTSSDIHDAKLRLSYDPSCEKLAGALSVDASDGTSQTLYAFVDKSNAGFAVGEKDGPYYTIPSKNFLKSFSDVAFTSLINLPKSTDIQAAARQGKNIAQILALGTADLSFDKTAIQNAATKLASHIRFLAPKKVYMGKETRASKIIRHNFTISAADVYDFFASILADGMQDINRLTDDKLSHVLSKLPNSPAVCYSFCAQTDGQNLISLQCTTPAISGDVYSAVLTFENCSRDIEISLSNLSDFRELLSVSASLSNSGIYCDANYFPSSVALRAFSDSASSELYLQVSFGKNNSIAIKGVKDSDSYIATLVSASSSPGHMMTLKIAHDNLIAASAANNVSIYKMTLGELLELGRKLDSFSSAVTG